IQCWFISVALIVLIVSHSQEVTVKPGENATLDCVGSSQAPIEVLKWVKPDLKSDHYVLFYRDENIQESYQHPLYVDRVKLRDPEMKDGDVSVIVKSVTINDTGIYECEVSARNTTHRKRAHAKLWCTINLKVENSGNLWDLWELYFINIWI
uniref:Ig-like domain-containing protein n=1 Tax=Anabas testudineus TaxID=64144 RepID=A0A3Q1I9H6_ANATE